MKRDGEGRSVGEGKPGQKKAEQRKEKKKDGERKERKELESSLGKFIITAYGDQKTSSTHKADSDGDFARLTEHGLFLL